MPRDSDLEGMTELSLRKTFHQFSVYPPEGSVAHQDDVRVTIFVRKAF